MQRSGYKLTRALSGHVPIILLLFGAVALWMVQAVGSWLKDNPPGFGDLMMYYLPGYEYAADCVRAGRLPLWNPYELCGVPFLAMLQYGCLYPPHVLHLLFPTTAGFFILTAIHLAIGVSGMYCLCRVLGLRRASAAVSATVFCFSGWVLFNSLVYPDAFRSGVWMPWAFATADLVARRRRVSYAVLFGLVLSLIFLGGEAEIAVRIAFLSAVYAVIVALTETKSATRSTACVTALGLILLAGSVIFSITAAQLLPTSEAWLMSARAKHGLSYNAVTAWGAVPPHLLVAGLIYTIPLEEQVYIGIIPLMLSFVGIGYTRRKSVSLFFAALAVLSLVLATGTHSPLWRLLYWLPGSSLFRYPHKFLAYFALSASVLAGMGTDRIGDAATCSGGHRVRTMVCLVLVAALTLSLIGLVTFVELPPGAPPRESLVSQSWYRGELSQIATVCGVVALLLILVRRVSLARLLPFVVVMIMVPACMMSSMSGYLPSRTTDIFRLPQEIETQLEAAGHDRLYVDVCVKGEWRLPKYGLVHRCRSLGGYEPLTPEDFALFCQPMYRRAGFRERPLREQLNIGLWGGLSSQLPAGHLLDMLAVRYVAVNMGSELFDTVKANGEYVFRYDKARFRPRVSDRAATVFENMAALPRAYTVSDARRVSGTAEAVGAIMNPGFDPRKVVLLECDVAGLPVGGNEGAPVEFLEDLPERVVLRTNTTNPGFLVLADQFYPGWTATLDGKPIPVYRANGLFRAVRIDAGEHRVEFHYEPFTATAGWAVSLSALVLVCTAGAFRARGFRNN